MQNKTNNDYSKILQELKKLKQWVLWGKRGIDKVKMPFSTNGRLAKTNDPSTWATFEDALSTYQREGYKGIGFVFSEDDPYCGLDFDKCISNGESNSWVKDKLHQLDSWTELSMSETGYHCLIKGKINENGDKKRNKLNAEKHGFKQLEIYEKERYFAFTGKTVSKYSSSINERQSVLNSIYDELLGEKSNSSLNICPQNLSSDEDEILLAKIRNSKNAESFKKLWNGITTPYESHSEADLALCHKLAWWILKEYGKEDHDEVDRLFRKSGLYRKKWDRDDYCQNTISKAFDLALKKPPELTAKKDQTVTTCKKNNKNEIDMAGLSTDEKAKKILNWLEKFNSKRIYNYQQKIGIIHDNDEKGKLVEIMDKRRLAAFVENHAKLVMKFEDGNSKPYDPSDKVYERCLYLVELYPSKWSFPKLKSIIRNPIFTKDGVFLCENRYYPEHRVLVDLIDLDIEPLPDKPTQQDVDDARDLIFEMLYDFPFVSDADRTHAVAFALYPLVKQIINELAPLHMVTAPKEGTGKSKLVEIMMMIVVGKKVPAKQVGRSEEEIDKRIVSLLLNHPSFVYYDNFSEKQTLDSQSLASVLRQMVYEGRKLGKSKMIEVENTAAWAITGNNLKTSGEISDRCVLIRLDSKEESPSSRDYNQFKHPYLEEWVSNNRSKLIHSLGVFVKHWIAQGKPESQKKYGRYIPWTKIMGGILEASGFTGFLDNKDDQKKEVVEEENEFKSFVKMWYLKYKTESVSVRDLFPEVEEKEMLRSFLFANGDTGRKRQLGKLLIEKQKQVFEFKISGELHKVKIEKLNISNGSLKYKLDRVNEDKMINISGLTKTKECIYPAYDDPEFSRRDEEEYDDDDYYTDDWEEIDES